MKMLDTNRVNQLMSRRHALQAAMVSLSGDGAEVKVAGIDVPVEGFANELTAAIEAAVSDVDKQLAAIGVRIS